MVCESGASLSNIVPIFEGTKIANGIKSLKLSGKNLNTILKKKLNEKNIDIENHIV